MFVTASSALRERGRSMTGSGGGRTRCCRLYSSADVESSIGGGGLGTLSDSFARRAVCEKLRAARTRAGRRARSTWRLAMAGVRGSPLHTQGAKADLLELESLS